MWKTDIFLTAAIYFYPQTTVEKEKVIQRLLLKEKK